MLAFGVGREKEEGREVSLEGRQDVLSGGGGSTGVCLGTRDCPMWRVSQG